MPGSDRASLSARMPYALRAGTHLRCYPSHRLLLLRTAARGPLPFTKTRASTPPEGHRALLPSLRPENRPKIRTEPSIITSHPGNRLKIRTGTSMVPPPQLLKIRHPGTDRGLFPIMPDTLIISSCPTHIRHLFPSNMMTV